MKQPLLFNTIGFTNKSLQSLNYIHSGIKMSAGHLFKTGNVLKSLAFYFFFLASQFILAQTPGSLDPAFNAADFGLGNGQSASYDDFRINTVVVQPDNKLLIGGFFGDYNGVQIKHLARLNEDGSLDTSFNTKVNGEVNTIAYQPNGKILIGGRFISYDGVSRSKIARLNSDGSLDTTFNPGTAVTGQSVMCITIQPDNKIVIGGSFSSVNGTAKYNIARLNENGALDTSFIAAFGGNSLDVVSDIVLQADAKIIAAGFSNNGADIRRYNTDGTLDTTFQDPTSGTGVSSIALQPDGKILAVGGFYDHVGSGGDLVRLNPNGTYDTVFNQNIAANYGAVKKILLQPNGKILVYKLSPLGFMPDSGTGVMASRLNANGTTDTTFNQNNRLIMNGRSIALQPNGKVVLCGEIRDYSDIVRSCIVRLEEDGNTDWSLSPVTGANGIIYKAVVQPDGKILIGGSFQMYNTKFSNAIARLNSNGTIDETFTTKITGATLLGATIYDIIVQPDGKIIIGGDFGLCDGVPRNKIARLNANGTLDTTFNVGTGITRVNTISDQLYNVALQQDGKILIPLIGSQYNGVTKNGIIRLHNDGSIDTSFNDQAFTWDSQASTVKVVVQQDQKIILWGDIRTVNGVTRSGMARLNTNGTLDTSFTTNTGFYDPVYNEITIKSYGCSVVLQSNGKIIVGGDMRYIRNTSNFQLVRLNTDGSYDSSFIPSTSANWFTITLQADDKLLLNNSANRSVKRLNANGSDDPTFYTGTGTYFTDYTGYASAGFVETIAVKADGKIIIAGNFRACNATARLNIAQLHGGDLSVDSGFNNGGLGINAVSEVRTIALQPDGKILIGGSFTTYNNTERNYIARLNSAGTLDTTFDSSIGANNRVYGIVIQADGKIIIGGLFTTYDNITRNYIARLNSDGTLDTGFNVGTGTDWYINAVVLQPDGKIVIAGTFTKYNGIERYRIARLNTDGTLDTTFNPGAGANTAITSLVLQPDGKLLIGGGFSSYNGTTINQVARINTDGTLDSSFNTGAGPNDYSYTIALQQDGKILVGAYTNGMTYTNSIARYNPDGTIDTNFTGGSINNGFGAGVKTIAVQQDGKLIIGGAFGIYNQSGTNRIVRLNADGSTDYSLDFGAGANSAVNCVLLKNNGNILVGGAFTSFRGEAKYGITEVGNTSLNVPENLYERIKIYPNPATTTLHLEMKNGLTVKNYSIYDITGKLLKQDSNTLSTINVTHFSKGVYILKIQTDSGEQTHKFIKE